MEYFASLGINLAATGIGYLAKIFQKRITGYLKAKKYKGVDINQ